MEEFFKDVCIPKPDAKNSCNALYAAYIWWCINHKEKPQDRKELGAFISSKGFSKEGQKYGTLFWVNLDISDEYKQELKKLGYI